jgi:hypothetical protein
MKRFLGDDGRGIAHVTMDGKSFESSIQCKSQALTLAAGDLSLSAEDKPPPQQQQTHFDLPTIQDIKNDRELEHEEDDFRRDERLDELRTSIKFLLAGGIAGAGKLTANYPPMNEV